MSTDQQIDCCRYNSLFYCRSCSTRCNPPTLAYTFIYEDIWRHASKDYINPYILKCSSAMNPIYYDYKVVLKPEGDQQLI